jgi:hypothetical protein
MSRIANSAHFARPNGDRLRLLVIAGRWRDPFWGSRYYDESWLTRFCMEVRGYQLEAAPRDQSK